MSADYLSMGPPSDNSGRHSPLPNSSPPTNISSSPNAAPVVFPYTVYDTLSLTANKEWTSFFDGEIKRNNGDGILFSSPVIKINKSDGRKKKRMAVLTWLCLYEMESSIVMMSASRRTVVGLIFAVVHNSRTTVSSSGSSSGGDHEVWVYVRKSNVSVGDSDLNANTLASANIIKYLFPADLPFNSLSSNDTVSPPSNSRSIASSLYNDNGCRCRCAMILRRLQYLYARSNKNGRTLPVIEVHRDSLNDFVLTEDQLDSFNANNSNNNNNSGDLLGVISPRGQALSVGLSEGMAKMMVAQRGKASIGSRSPSEDGQGATLGVGPAKVKKLSAQEQPESNMFTISESKPVLSTQQLLRQSSASTLDDLNDELDEYAD